MKTRTKKLIFHIATPLAVGGLATLLSGGMKDFARLQKPPLSPPGWLFPIVWTVLYVLMGLAYDQIAERPENQKAKLYYYIQLGLNFLWPILFFRFQAYLIAFGVLVALWAVLTLCMRRFSILSEKAGDLLIPYSLWVTFAGYLNLGIYLLNTAP